MGIYMEERRDIRGDRLAYYEARELAYLWTKGRDVGGAFHPPKGHLAPSYARSVFGHQGLVAGEACLGGWVDE